MKPTHLKQLQLNQLKIFSSKVQRQAQKKALKGVTPSKSGSSLRNVIFSNVPEVNDSDFKDLEYGSTYHFSKNFGAKDMDKHRRERLVYS
jgi:hypothetical protein